MGMDSEPMILKNTRQHGSPPLHAPTGSVAERIADRILRAATGSKATRVQLMAGHYPDHERRVGGLCEAALANEIQAALLDSVGLDCPRCAALQDAIAALKDFVDGKRHDCENIAEIMNGALCLPPNTKVSSGAKTP